MESKLHEHVHFEAIRDSSAPATYVVPAAEKMAAKPRDAFSRAQSGEPVAFSQMQPPPGPLPTIPSMLD